MLAKANRITRGADFRRVVRAGRRAGGTFAIVYRAEPGSRTSRFGFVVSKRVGGAVVRNRVKRRLSAIVREHAIETDPADVVIRALPTSATADFVTLRSEVQALMERR